MRTPRTSDFDFEGGTDYDRYEDALRAYDNEQDDRFEEARERHRDEDADRLWQEKQVTNEDMIDDNPIEE